MGTCTGKTGQHSGPRPSPKEVGLAARLSKGCNEPPFFAVQRAWLEDWIKFATHSGPPPGPISNADVVARGIVDADLAWVSAEAWKLLSELHGGGPALRRSGRELLPTAPASLPPLVQGGSAASSATDLEKRIRRAAHMHEAWYQALRSDLMVEAERLQRGPWAAGAQKPGGAAGTAARKRVLQAIFKEAGGEELRLAVREAREAGESGERLLGLDALVQGLCVHEEAQTVLACLLQALLDSDRLGLEMWLEQAEAMGLEAQEQGSQLLGPLNLYVMELEDRERRTLEAHATNAVETEGSDARLWRIAVTALNEDDEEALTDVIAEAKKAGLDASSVELCLEELYIRRRKQKQRQEPPRPPGSTGSSEGAPNWNDPTSWRSDDDFFEAFRRKRRQDEEAGRSSSRRPWADEEERSPSRPSRSSGRQAGTGEQHRRREEDPRARQSPGTDGSRQRSGTAAGDWWTRRDDEDRYSRRPSGRDGSSQRHGGTAAGDWWTRKDDEEDEDDPFARRMPDMDGSSQRHGRSSASRVPNANAGRPAPNWDNPGAWTSTDDFLRAWRAKQEEREAAEEERRREEQRRQQQQVRHSAAIGSTDGALSALGLPPGRVVSMAELKAAYRSMALRHHPDRPQNRGRQEEATAEFQRIRAAFDLLAPGARC